MDCDSPLRKKHKFTGSELSFEDIQSDLYHLARIKEQIKIAVYSMYKSEFVHKMKYLQNVELQLHNVTKEIPEISDKFVQQTTENHKQLYKETSALSRKLERHQFFTEILEKKNSCKISKMVDNI